MLITSPATFPAFSICCAQRLWSTDTLAVCDKALDLLMPHKAEVMIKKKGLMSVSWCIINECMTPAEQTIGRSECCKITTPCFVTPFFFLGEARHWIASKAELQNTFYPHTCSTQIKTVKQNVCAVLGVLQHHPDKLYWQMLFNQDTAFIY